MIPIFLGVPLKSLIQLIIDWEVCAMSYQCKHFDIQELVTPQMYSDWGDRCWALFDDRLLRLIDTLREKLGPCTINDWSWGGKFKNSGLRDQHFYGTTKKYLASRSQHKYGRAVDMKFKQVSAQAARKYIIEHQTLLADIRFVECGPLKQGQAMNWVHIDVRNEQQLCCWSPSEGVIEQAEVVRRHL